MKEYIRNTYGDKETTTSAAQAMNWHRNGDTVTVSKNGKILAVIAGAALAAGIADFLAWWRW